MKEESERYILMNLFPSTRILQGSRIQTACSSLLLRAAMLLFITAPMLFGQIGTHYQYFYDDLGQIVKVTDSSGTVIEYVYDRVGNILQIKRSSITAGTLAVFGFSPAQGPIGQKVTIQGQAFDTTPGNNLVQFNGVAATIISATVTTLVVTVPAGATSGPVSVTVAGVTATSSNNFTVLAVPVITSITPHLFNVNTTIPNVQVTGFNLSGASFGFLPVFAPPALSVASAAIDSSGTSATLGLTAGDPAGSYVLVATNAAGSSSGFASAENSVTLLDASIDVTPPTISITRPGAETSFSSGQALDVIANASDNVDVTAVEFSVNGTPFAPGPQTSFGTFDLAFTIPVGVSDLTFGATARDAAANIGIAKPIHVTVKPDPLTTVTGKVVDATLSPVAGANVTLAVQGLNAEFFRFSSPLAAIPDLNGRSADAIKLVANVNMLNPNQMFGADPFGVNLGMDYAVRLTGQLQIADPGIYTFKLAADEAARLTVGGTTVAEIASGAGALQQDTGIIGLTAGAVPVEIVFVHNLGNADIQLFFTPPGGSAASSSTGVETIVPQASWRAQALQVTAITDNSGTFSFSGVPTITGNIQATATAILAGVELSGTSASFSPVSGGMTDLGAIVVVPSRWVELGPVGIAPGPRNGFGQGTYDEISNRMMVYGGSIFFLHGDVPVTPDPGDPQLVWVLTHASGATGQPRWTVLNPVSDPKEGVPPDLQFQSTAYDSTHNRLIVFGGFVGRTFTTLNDVWVLENANGIGGPAAWNKLLPQGDAPGPRFDNTAVYDPASNSLIIFGGFDFSGFSTYSDVWVLSNANGLGGLPVWTQLQPVGGPPSGIVQASAIYDSTNNRMTVFGGSDSSFVNFTNAVWVLTNANGQGGTPEWMNVVPEGAVGSPSVRFGTSTVYDQGNDRMIIFGGGQPSFSVANDTWVLTGANGLGETAAWFQLSPANPPPPRSFHGAAFDSASDRMIMFGGSGSFGFGNDTWALTSANGLINGATPAGIVLGMVTLAGGTPAADAVVRVSTMDSGQAFFKQTRTDLNGDYTISGVPVGRTFSVRAFEPRGISFVDSPLHAITSDAQAQIVNLSLPAAAAVKVTIMTSNGNPLVGARVVIQDSFKQYSRLAGFTDGDGVLVIADVPEGNFTIQAQDRGTQAALGDFTGTVTAGDLGQTISVSFVSAPTVKKVLVASGVVDFTLNVETDTSELYDPGTGTWTPVQNAIPNRPPDFAGGFCGANMAALASGQAVFAGGGCADGGVTTNAASLYLPESNQWVETAPMRHGRNQFAMLTLNNGNALAVGGCAGGCQGPNVLGEDFSQVSNTSEVYDFQLQSWTTPTLLNVFRAGLGSGNFSQTAATLLDGRVLVCNGNDGLDTTFFDSCEVYSPTANQWMTTSPVGETGPHPIAVLKNGKALVVMNDGLSAKLFDPATEMWTAAGPPIQKQMHGILTTLKTGDVLFTGGTDDSGSVSTVQVYHPATDQWTVVAAMSTSRSGHIAIALDDGTVLVAGGVDVNSVILNSAEIFDPVSGAWSMTGSMLQPRVGANAVVITTFK